MSRKKREWTGCYECGCLRGGDCEEVITELERDIEKFRYLNVELEKRLVMANRTIFNLRDRATLRPRLEQSR